MNCLTILITAEWETAKRSPAARHVMPSTRTASTNLSRRSFDNGFIFVPHEEGESCIRIKTLCKRELI